MSQSLAKDNLIWLSFGVKKILSHDGGRGGVESPKHQNDGSEGKDQEKYIKPEVKCIDPMYFLVVECRKQTRHTQVGVS